MVSHMCMTEKWLEAELTTFYDEVQC